MDLLIRELAAANLQNRTLQEIAGTVASGYSRQMARDLLRRFREIGPVKDVWIGEASLRESIVRTLEIEVDRLDAESRLSASLRREKLMKELFLARYRQEPSRKRSKVLVRFGRNHLHRGYDRRGVSTLGNFLAEFAIVQGIASFHLAAFGAGGQVYLRGRAVDADERPDDPAFALLASLARYPETVFDLRPLRAILHRIPERERSPALKSLVYWADSYDAIICYRQVTPATP